MTDNAIGFYRFKIYGRVATELMSTLLVPERAVSG